MFRKLIKTSKIEIDGQLYGVQFFEQETMRGVRRFNCEVVLSATDRIIIDGESMSGLELRVARLAPATVYSRLLAARQRAA